MNKCNMAFCVKEGCFELFNAHETGSHHYCKEHKMLQMKYNNDNWRSIPVKNVQAQKMLDFEVVH